MSGGDVCGSVGESGRSRWLIGSYSGGGGMIFVWVFVVAHQMIRWINLLHRRIVVVVVWSSKDWLRWCKGRNRAGPS